MRKGTADAQEISAHLRPLMLDPSRIAKVALEEVE
jgi:hypothetical protein